MEGLIIDCFCGGGGATEGIEQALGRAVDIGVNGYIVRRIFKRF